MGSVEAQKDYFEKLIQQQPDWEFVGIYADEGISGTSLNRREDFNRMITNALDGKIDFIITKSLSRFARNTVDTLNTIRKLKLSGIGVYFEKEDINTLDSKGEFLITLMSSLAEEESRSISENVKWGLRKRFADGKYTLPYKQFLGYKKGPDGAPELVAEEAKIIRAIYRLCLEGSSYTAFLPFLSPIFKSIRTEDQLFNLCFDLQNRSLYQTWQHCRCKHSLKRHHVLLAIIVK